MINTTAHQTWQLSQPTCQRTLAGICRIPKPGGSTVPDKTHHEGRKRSRQSKAGCTASWIALLCLGAGPVAQATARPAETALHAAYDRATGRATITEAGKPVLGYIYQENPVPAGFFDGMDGKKEKSARRYAVPRSDYIHPLYGIDGTPLTTDWSKDHAHHRGIYWAWPEVGFGGETGDLHALQQVWARPTGKLHTRHGDGWAEIEAENRWMWKDRTPIVLETAIIRAWRTDGQQRRIDLTLRFEALVDGVTLARRGTKTYGGLNIRLAPIADLRLIHHVDPEGTSPRMAWQAAVGLWKGAVGPASMTVFEPSSNPGYPADYIEYPALPWFQPTFPRAGTKHALEPGRPLTLRYGICLRSGAPPSVEELRAAWRIYQQLPQ
jgi:hypothetical protein